MIWSKGEASAEGDGVLIAVRVNALLPGRIWVHRYWHGIAAVERVRA